MKNKKILHVIPGYGGGISSHVKNISKSIDGEKIIIDVASFTDYSTEFIEDIERKNGKVFTLKNVKLFKIKECIIEYSNLLKHNGPYDIVHIHLVGYKALYFSIISRFSGIKRIVCHAHAASDKNSDKIKKKINMFFSRLLTIIAADELASCSRMASVYIFGKKSVENNKVMHIPNSIDISKYTINIDENIKKNFYKDNNINPESLVIGHIGCFGYQKNHDFMVKIIDRLDKKGINFVWLFIGDGDEKIRIENLINEKKLNEKVRFLGRREDVNIIYKFLNVSVLPSYFEGLPTVTIESQAAGIPTVISTNITKEVDMNIGLVKYISLNSKIDEWIDGIIEMSRIDIPAIKKRIEKMEEYGFTTDSVGKLYREFVFGQRRNYNLGDKI